MIKIIARFDNINGYGTIVKLDNLSLVEVDSCNVNIPVVGDYYDGKKFYTPEEANGLGLI